MDHNRPVSKHDHDTLVLIQANVGNVVIAPVFFNGEARQALALVMQNEAGIYLRILGIAINPSDQIQDKLGAPADFSPPIANKEALN